MEKETKSTMKSGVAGSIVLMPSIIMLIILAIAPVVAPASIFHFGTNILQVWYVVASATTSWIFGMGILLVSIGTYGLWKLYKNMFPLVVGIIGLVAIPFWYLQTPVSVFNLGIGIIIGTVASILAGVFFILLGAAFIPLREKIGSIGLSLTTSIMSIIGGLIFCIGAAITLTGHIIGIVMLIIGSIMLIPAAICVALIFFKLLS